MSTGRAHLQRAKLDFGEVMCGFLTISGPLWAPAKRTWITAFLAACAPERTALPSFVRGGRRAGRCDRQRRCRLTKVAMDGGKQWEGRGRSCWQHEEVIKDL